MEPPAACYQDCNNAFLEAQVVGKTAKLCSESSDFSLYYSRCHSCILAMNSDSGDTISAYLDPTFAEYTAYCQELEASVDPSWYTPMITWTMATYTVQNGPTTTVRVLVDTIVLRSDWTGFQTTTSAPVIPTSTPVLPTSTTSQPGIITSSRSLTSTATTPAASSIPGSEKSDTGASTHGPSPWVWAIVGAVVALTLIGAGILLFLYRRGKLRSLKHKWKLGRTTAHPHELDGDSAWRTGDKPELHGESRLVAGGSSTEDTKSMEPPKELDSSVVPVELAVNEDTEVAETRGRAAELTAVELPAEVHVASSDDVEGVRGDLQADNRGGAEEKDR
ncbi:hypothetical protein B0T20DRAFT_246378 [Sordaria brevicollis]|uniref:Uncharacterized protein n=1 Tax=Sordaria brevicollis TaxID=83679 RepID=A0AAE0PBM5_SORBR|nr:hypothetical protein B0T20DRAFT_246378 [Sordaria brevicollis]